MRRDDDMRCKSGIPCCTADVDGRVTMSATMQAITDALKTMLEIMESHAIALTPVKCVGGCARCGGAAVRLFARGK